MNIGRRLFVGALSCAFALRPHHLMGQMPQGSDEETLDLNSRWFLLNNRHPDFSRTRDYLFSIWRKHSASARFEEVDGRNAGESIVRAYITPQQKAASPISLVIGIAAVLDEFNYSNSHNAAYGPREMHRDEWGGLFPVWGSFLEPPLRLPTDGEDRRLAHAKGVGNDTVLYVGQNANGAGDGTCYINRIAVRDILGQPAKVRIDPTKFTILVLCGRLSRFANEGDQSGANAGAYLIPRPGSASVRTIIMSHPVDQCELMTGCKIGNGGNEGTWVNDVGHRWRLSNATGYGGGDPFNALSNPGFVMSDAGGMLRALTQVKSAAAVAVTSDSYFIQWVSPRQTDVFVHLADGSNPKNTTYFERYVAGGINVARADYTDYIGIRNYGGMWLGGESNWRAFNCWFGYSTQGACIRAQSGTVDEASGGWYGAFSPETPDGRLIQGCLFQFAKAGIYDTCGGHDAVPANTIIRDSLFKNIGVKDADAFGVNLTEPADNHSIASMGTKGHVVRNNRFDNCAWLTIVHYAMSNTFADPAPLGISDRPGYVRGLILSKSIRRPDGTYTFQTPCYSLRIEYNWITNTVTPKENPGLIKSSGMGISLNGDSDCYGFAGQIRDIKIRYNRIAGAFDDGAIRTKYEIQLTSYAYTEIEIAYNTIRGAVLAFRSLGSAIDENGAKVEPSFLFHHNDVHAQSDRASKRQGLFVALSTVSNPKNHRMILDHNIYRIAKNRFNERVGWRSGSEKISTSLMSWRHMAPRGDIYDTNSRTELL